MSTMNWTRRRWTKHAQRGGVAGNLLTIILVGGLLALGAWLVLRDGNEEGADAATQSQSASAQADPDAPEPIEPGSGGPQLQAAATYQAKDNIIDIDISEYAGYGGLIVANGGLAPNPESVFAREHGFQVRLNVSEDETWSKLNNGGLGATATTVDALAVLGRTFAANIPVQIGFSRGADMVVVDTGIASINQLAGKVLGASQYNESEFFIRYLASEAGVPVKVLRDLDARPAANEIGLVFYEDAFVACDAYEHELGKSEPRLDGCVGWSPRTEEVIAASAGRAKMLVSNRNLLVIADVLAVNKGWADANPKQVQGLVQGLLEGNRRLRDDQANQLAVVARAFKWDEAKTRDELAKVHLSNLPENRAFFAGTIDSAGSFGGIFQSSVLAYGSVIKNPTDSQRFADVSHLEALAKAGAFAGQKIAIAPIRTSRQVAIEGDPLLSKDIRFFFEPNSAALDAQAPQNAEYLDTIKRFLQVSPGSMVLLRGHVDNARVGDFRREGGEELVRSMALKAMELSRQRAKTVADALLARHKEIDAARLESVGRGWEEPASEDSEQNRRVEVQWFTLE